MSNRITGNTYIDGVLRALQIILSDGCVNDAAVVANAAIQSTKLRHRHCQPYAQSGTAVAATSVVHVAQSAGAVTEFSAGLVAACTGNAAVTVDLKKNGTTVLSGVVTVDVDNAAYELVDGTIASVSYVAGDVFTVVVTVNAGTGALGTGLFGFAVFDEAAT